MNNNKSLINIITKYDSLFIFSVFCIIILIIILLTGLFNTSDNNREQILFSPIGNILLGFVFIFIVFKFMGEKITIFDKTFDVGIVIYIFIVFFIIFMFGN